jgi:hypothetical protein
MAEIERSDGTTPTDNPPLVTFYDELLSSLPPSTAEIITGVAIQLFPKTDDKFSALTCVLPRPYRHHHIIHSLHQYTTFQSVQGRQLLKKGTRIEGFFTNHNRFLPRADAYLLAQANGQLNRRQGENLYQGTELFSEDLW